MDKNAFYQRLKKLNEYLRSCRDERGLLLLNEAMETLHSRTLSDVSEGELMGFLRSIEEMECTTSHDEWVSANALRTDVGLVTRGMIEKEINRRSVEL